MNVVVIEDVITVEVVNAVTDEVTVEDVDGVTKGVDLDENVIRER